MKNVKNASDILEHAPCGFLIARADGVVLEVNKTFAQWVSADAAELVGKRRFQDLLTEPDRIHYETTFQPLLQTQGFISEMMGHLARPGNAPLPVLVSATLAKDDADEDTLRITVFNASERETYERELRAARTTAERLAAIVQSSRDAILTVSLSGVVETWNAAATHMFGYSLAEAVGADIGKLIVPEGAEYHPDFESGANFTMTGGILETFRRRRNATLLPVSASRSPIYDAANRLCAVAVIYRDVSDFHRASEALIESRARLLHAAQNAGISYVIIDLVAKTVTVSENRSAITGVALADARLPHSLTEDELDVLYQNVHPDDKPALRTMWLRELAGEATPKSEFRLLGADGVERWIERRSTLERNMQGDPASLFITCRNITEEKRASDRLLGLLREVNHRSKNMLAVVQSITRQTARTGDPGRFVELLSNRIASLSACQDLLIDNDWKHVPLRRLISSQIAIFPHAVGSRIDVEGDALMLVLAASQPLGLALHELVSNATVFGALSMPGGRAGLSWRLDGDASKKFSLRWTERGGPRPAAPLKAGFGYTVLSRMVESAMSGRAEFDYQGNGFEWRFAAPFDAVIDAGAAATTH